MRVVVTGGSRGIGGAITELLAREGHAVVAVSRSGALPRSDLGDRVLGYPADLAGPVDMDALVADLWEGGGIDALVHNAGVSPVYTAADKIEAATWDAILRLNLTVPFLLSQAYARKVMATDTPAGHIVMVSSIGAQVGLRRLAAYTASKAGLSGLARALALDWAPWGIRVNSVEPGYVRTEMTADMLSHKRIRDEVIGAVPLGRPADAREIAGVVSFLLSPAAAYMTGAALRVDGGYTAG